MAWTINNGKLYFNSVLYTGNGGTQSITGVGFQPDWVWTKGRSGARGHTLVDVIRGATKTLESSTTSAEETHSNSITAIGSDGFSLGNRNQGNANSETFVSWNWKAGTSSGINTTNSTITPAGYSFNQTSGFSIIKYPGNGTNDAKCPHGLGVAPKMIFIKDLGNAANWECYNASIGNGKVIYLNLTTAAEATSARWRNTSPDSVNWTMGSTTAVNGSGRNYVAYCFADVQGYSKIGSYTGNGNADGTFVYTGFKPAFVIIKKTTAGDDWYMNTGKINGYNVQNDFLAPNEAAAEVVDNTAQPIDMISNGFKMRGTGTGNNSSGVSYIYMAFAENPFTSSTGTPVTAR